MPQLRLRATTVPSDDTSHASLPLATSKRRRIHSSLITLLLSLSTFLLLSSGRIHSQLSKRMDISLHQDTTWGWEPTPSLRQGTAVMMARHRVPPRMVTQLDRYYLSPVMVPQPSSSSMTTRMYQWFFGRKVWDPMLHQDGYESSNWMEGMMRRFWNHRDKSTVQIPNDEDESCVPMAQWQTTSYPNCNSVHEIDFVHSSDSTHHLTFLGQGWFRSAWKMDVQGISRYWDDDEDEWVDNDHVVLKTLRMERDFLEEYYELHRRDALAMERLTFSPYVLNIYGYCGQSAINELANFGVEGLTSLEQIARQFRGANVEPVNKIKLQLASMVASGVSHMHSIDYPDHIPKIGSPPRITTSNATLVHYDLNPRNIAIVKRGRPKLNDFNVAEFLTWDTKRNATCGFQGRFREPWWRAPEEMHFHEASYSHPSPLTEKVDIYSLGNILLTILTSHSPRGKMTKERMEEIRPKVARGELPKLPSDFNETEAAKDPALNPIIHAVYQCLRPLPEDRPSAGEIAELLNRAVDNLPEEYGDKQKYYHSLERQRLNEKLKGKSKKH